MNKPSLSDLYRRMASAPSATSVDAEALVAAVSARVLDPERRDVLAGALAGSTPHAALARMLRELEADSKALAADVAEMRARPMHRARRGHGVPRHAVARRPRVAAWIGALAACFVFAFVIGLRDRHADTGHATWDDVAASSGSVALPDRIFTSRDRIFAAADDAAEVRSPSDSLFRAGFAAGG